MIDPRNYYNDDDIPADFYLDQFMEDRISGGDGFPEEEFLWDTNDSDEWYDDEDDAWEDDLIYIDDENFFESQ